MQCKTSIKHTLSLHVAWGFLIRRLKRDDRHHCHVTGSDHTYLNARIFRWSALDKKAILLFNYNYTHSRYSGCLSDDSTDFHWTTSTSITCIDMFYSPSRLHRTCTNAAVISQYTQVLEFHTFKSPANGTRLIHVQFHQSLRSRKQTTWLLPNRSHTGYHENIRTGIKYSNTHYRFSFC